MPCSEDLTAAVEEHDVFDPPGIALGHHGETEAADSLVVHAMNG